MIATADSSFQTKVLLLDQTLFDFPFIFFLLLLIFLTAIWLPHSQPWTIIERTVSLTRC